MNLFCKSFNCLEILFKCHTDNLQVLRSFLQKCLEMCHSEMMTSMAIPPVGTGYLGYPPQDVVKILLEEVESFSASNPTTALNDVYLVVYYKDESKFAVSFYIYV